ncbi:Uncharacterized conserved protein [Serratia rubidaea]|uniref:Uncharacterized conserved protein n=1 Tax=Serratia rubidaea TaxID=61652 RepID=A0A4U9HQQ2_SERRU|nr:Uncharacterized conserved protein [Serratia rubidaea]
MANGHYELKKSGSNGQFHFTLKASNGEIILSSEMYTSKASAENGIASVQTNSPHEAQYESKVSSNGKPYFVLKAKKPSGDRHQPDVQLRQRREKRHSVGD